MKKLCLSLIILLSLVTINSFSQNDKTLISPTDTGLEWGDYDSIPKPHNFGPTDLTSITTDDNENNHYTGYPDNDMDIYLYRYSPQTPIEFNILIEDKTISDAKLSILAWDVDWDPPSGRPGERDAVYLNGNFVGFLSGADDEWSTSIFDVNPAYINPGPNGKNTVRIDVDINSDRWAVEVDWGQLVINNPEGDAEFRYVVTDREEYYASEPILVTEEVDADPTTYVRVETNILNPDGQIVSGQSYYLFATMGDEPFTLMFNLDPFIQPGDYTVLAILYDAASNLQQDIMYVPITILEPCIDPYWGGYIGSSQRNCGAFNPEPLISYYPPNSYYGNLEYKWQRSLDGITYVDIPNSNVEDFDPGMVSVKTYFRRMVRVDCSPDWSTAQSSNYVLIDILTPAIVDAGPDKQIYIGYPPYEAQLQATANQNGFYVWQPPTGLSNPYITDPIAAPAETTTYKLYYYAENGCFDKDEVTVTVTDVRCGQNMNKVLVCHLPPGNPNNPQTICIGAPAVPAHLEHGDYLGECIEDKLYVIAEVRETTVKVYPNPSEGPINIELELVSDSYIDIYISDIFGNIIDNLRSGHLTEGTHQYTWVHNKSGSGLYFLHIITNEGSIIKKILIK